MADEIKHLQDAQARVISLEELAVKLLGGQKSTIDGLKQQLADAIAANDPTAIQAVADSLNAESDKLDAAIAAVQPAPAAPAPEPTA